MRAGADAAGGHVVAAGGAAASFEARWTDKILREMSGTLEIRLGRGRERALSRESAMREHFPEALVTGYESLTPELTNHPKDRHVLAAALRCEADILVTFNLKDFPERSADGRLAVVGPSAFLRQLWQWDPEEIRERLSQQARAIGMSEKDLRERLRRSIPGFVADMES